MDIPLEVDVTNPSLSPEPAPGPDGAAGGAARPPPRRAAWR